MAKQLTIFVENRPGRLELIVDKPNDAYLALADVGCACALKDILAVSVPDQPGNFHRLTSALAENNINVLEDEELYGL